MYVLQSNRGSKCPSHNNFIDFRFDLSVAIFPLCSSFVGLTVCMCTDRLLLWFSASETRKSSITNYSRHTQSLTCSELSSNSIQLSTYQNRSNAATQNTATTKQKQKNKKHVHLAWRNSLFLSSLLLQSVTSHFSFYNNNKIMIIDQTSAILYNIHSNKAF